VQISSGVTALDEEAVALLRRAQPFPQPPPEILGERVYLTVPIRFNLRGMTGGPSTPEGLSAKPTAPALSIQRDQMETSNGPER
jgi:hypothetical protein